MAFTTDRDEDELEELRALAYESIEKGKTKYPGMTYEEGIRATLDWIQGDSDDMPLGGDD